MWHYVAQWVRSVGLDPVNDRIEADSFPSPGTVPTMLAYQGETYDWSPTLDDLPPIVREARALFADFIAGLNDGRRDPDTVYFADAVRALKTPPDDGDHRAPRTLLAGHARAVRRALVRQRCCRPRSSPTHPSCPT